MARSSYIYVLYRFDENEQRILGAFTVKHEMDAYRKRSGLASTTYAKRYRDGYPDIPPTEVELD